VSDGDAGQHPPIPTPHHLAGFQVRRSKPHEIAGLQAFFPGDPLGNKDILYLGAFGQPGDVPLGAAIVRPSRRGSVKTGHFLIFVRPECRRQKIGSTLVRHLYSLALSNHADLLIFSELIHQDLPENAFYLSCGLTAERAFATYSVEIKRVLDFCEPIIQRFLPSDPTLADMRIQMLNTLNFADLAEFFAPHFGGFADQCLAKLHAGVYDLSLSSAAVRDNQIIAAGLTRTRPNVPSLMLDYILAAPPYRSSPISLAIVAHSVRIALQRGLTHCVFEADERYDHFAVGFARRCGAKPQWKRFRYSISGAEMEARVK
jgi:GNAT superfamily N-acetyltransferase